MPNTTFDLPPVEKTTVQVIEMGYRPAIMTPARTNAPQAATALGQMFEQRRFGELAVLILDWDNSLGHLPPDAVKPILYMEVTRWFPEHGEGVSLTVQGRIDVDDVFGADVLTRSVMEELVNEIGETLAAKAKEK